MQDIDFILLAGDFTLFGKGCHEFISSVEKLNKPVYFVLGNHETDRIDPLTIEKEYPLFHYCGYQMISFSIGTNYYSIFGMDGDNSISPHHPIEEESIEFYTSLLQHSKIPPKSTRILLSHFLPDALYTPHFEGSKAVSQIYNWFKPDLTVCGHEHKSGGQFDSNKGIYNASYTKEKPFSLVNNRIQE